MSEVNHNFYKHSEDKVNPAFSALSEFLYSLPVGIMFFTGSRNTAQVVCLSIAWLAYGTATGIARYAGLVTQRECRDLRFMFYSLHGKIPMWVNWVFWLTLAATFIKPLFALTLCISVLFAFNRGYRNFQKDSLLKTRVIVDVIVRIIAGFLVIRPGML